ncbi:MAG: hypothetical protein AABW81_01510 [Nanoarchaeota archaeon]
MLFLVYLERILVVLLFIFFFTQLILPPFIGKKFFWSFRKSEKKICSKKDELSELEDAEKLVELDTEIKKKREDLNKKMTGKKE